MSQARPYPAALKAILALVFGLTAPGVAVAVEFEVRFTPAVRADPLEARVYVMLGPASARTGTKGEPRFGPDWFHPQPFFAVDARDWAPETPLRVGRSADGFPAGLDALAPGDYAAQAVIRLNPDTHRIGDGAGNAYGPVTRFTVGPEAEGGGPVRLTVDAVVPPRTPPDTDRVKFVATPSPRLTAFYRRPVAHRAAVILPEGEPAAPRGTLYIVPSFGGDHTTALEVVDSPVFAFGKDLLRVVLDPDCGTGHHAFADSATNGPRGRALVEELIPYIESTFHAPASPGARLLNGHSSGGWSSLWLQVTYPDVFGGVWSTSPDSVDFRDFQKVDLYAPGANVFRDPEGRPRPIARRGTTPVLFYEGFSKMEDVLGDGGQLHSFEAVFSPLGPGGRPRPLWDRATGAVDPEVARAWERYDIRLAVERGWPDLAPKLRGKLHVVVGDLDTFYLEGAVRLLKASLDGLGADASVEVVPGLDHSTILSAPLAARFAREMAAAVTPANPGGR